MPDKVIQRRMGHASPSTTDRHVKAAETFDLEGVGIPFPPLPAGVYPEVRPTKSKTPKFSRGFSVARVGFEAKQAARIDTVSPSYDTSSVAKVVDAPPKRDDDDASGAAFRAL